jgi:hypothetical protein
MTRADRTTAAYALARIRFARQSGPIPPYGSQEWLELAPDDVRKAAAVWIAAECWRQEYEPERIAERHLIDLAARRDADAADWQPVAEWVRRTSDQPTHAELTRRWAEVAA